MDIKVATWNIRGLNTFDKQKEVKKLITEEKLHLCAVIETRVKYSKIKNIGDIVFGNWEYVTNAENNNKGCRIMVGWDQNMLATWLITKTKQSMLFLVETLCQRTNFFCTVVNASNYGVERRKLWKELGAYKQITNGNSWVILGDFNVTLEAKEHSNGSSVPTSDMTEFKNCVEELEIEDILSSGVMINENFLDKFPTAHSVFLPYLISDHSPAILTIPKGCVKRKRAFRMFNFITDKEDFLPVVAFDLLRDALSAIFGLSELKVESAIGKSLSDQAFASSGKVAKILHKVYDVETFITHMFPTSGGPVKHIPAVDVELSFAQEHQKKRVNSTSSDALIECLHIDVLSAQWDRFNAIMLTWIMNYVSQDVYMGLVYSDNAADVWKELKSTYDKVDGYVIFNLLQKLIM
ncbi:RNA-directed DNA polymerase, eukaryota, reverse transcriptase zinc-binding domain protein [Tanacetum coccineum]